MINERKGKQKQRTANNASYAMWGTAVTQRFSSFCYLYPGLISMSLENPHGTYAHRYGQAKKRHCI